MLPSQNHLSKPGQSVFDPIQQKAAELLPGCTWDFDRRIKSGDFQYIPDAIISWGNSRLALEWKTAQSIYVGVKLRNAAFVKVKLESLGYQLVLTTVHMTAPERKICTDLGIGYWDWLGNIDVTAPGLRIFATGTPSPKTKGRVRNPLNGKSRQVLDFLADKTVGEAPTRHEIAKITKIARNVVYVSVNNLVTEGLVSIAEDGGVNLTPDGKTVLEEAIDSEPTSTTKNKRRKS